MLSSRSLLCIRLYLSRISPHSIYVISRFLSTTGPIVEFLDPSQCDEAQVLSTLYSVDENQFKKYLRVFGEHAETWQPTSEQLATTVGQNCDRWISNQWTGTELADALRIYAFWNLPLPTSVDNKAREWLTNNLETVSLPVYFSFLVTWATLTEMKFTSSFVRSLATKGLSFLADANPEQLTQYIWAWRKRKGYLKEISPNAMKLWFELSLKQIHVWNDKQISIALVSLVREQIEPSKVWWQAVLARIMTLENIGTQPCANIMHSFSRLIERERISEKEQNVINHVSQFIMGNLPRMKGLELANAVRAFAVLHVDVSKLDKDGAFWSNYWKIFNRYLTEVQPLDLVMHLQFWKYSNHFPDHPLLKKLEDRIITMVDVELAISFVARFSPYIINGDVSDKILRHLFDCWFVDVLTDFQLTYGLYCWSNSNIDPGKMNENFWEWFWDTTLDRLKHFDGDNILHISVALARLDKKPPREWLIAVQDTVMQWSLITEKKGFCFPICLPRSISLFAAVKFAQALVRLEEQFGDISINEQMILRFYENWVKNLSPDMDILTLTSGLYTFSAFSPCLAQSNVEFLPKFWQITAPMIPEMSGRNLYYLLNPINQYSLKPPDPWLCTAIDSMTTKQGSPDLWGKFLYILAGLKAYMDPLQTDDVARKIYRTWYKVLQQGQHDAKSFSTGFIGLMYCNIDPGCITPGFWRNFAEWSKPFLPDLRPRQRVLVLKTVIHFGAKMPDSWVNSLISSRSIPNGAQVARYLQKLAQYQRFNRDFIPQNGLINTYFTHWCASLDEMPVNCILMVIEHLNHLQFDVWKLSLNSVEKLWQVTAEKASELKQSDAKELLKWASKHKLSPPQYWYTAMENRLAVDRSLILK